MEKHNTNNIRTQYFNNSKASRAMVREYTRDTQICVTLGDVITTVDISNTAALEILDGYTITEQDRMVLDAIYSLYKSGLEVMTVDQIVKQYTGNDKANISKHTRDIIDSVIEKLSTIRVRIDCTDELNRHYTPKVAASAIFSGYVLPCTTMTVTSAKNGRTVKAVKILDTPPTHRYAERNGQMINVPAALLQTAEHFKDTEESVVIKRYIVRRVAQIVADNGLNSNRISLQWYDKTQQRIRGLLPELGYNLGSSPADRKKKARIVKIITGTLETLITQEYIAGYKIYRKGNSTNPSVPVSGFVIIRNRKA